MITILKEQLKKEIAAKNEAVKPYNIRIKNLRTAISNLENFNKVAYEVNSAEKEKFDYIDEQ